MDRRQSIVGVFRGARRLTTLAVGYVPGIWAVSSGEKSQAPTPQRRKQARQKGQGWHSPDFQSGLGLLVAFIMLRLYLPWVGHQLGTLEAATLTLAEAPKAFAQNLGSIIMVGGHTAMGILMALVLPVMVIGVASGLLQSGFRVSLVPLSPDFNRMNPVSGLQRMFSRESLWLLVKGILKLGIIGIAAGLVIWHQIKVYPTLIGQPLGVAVHQAFVLLTAVLWRAALAYILIGVVDIGYQYLKFQNDLKMTHHELRDEMKDVEGNPLIRGKRREMAKKLARTGMRQVKDSQVIITNPTHYAVALKWDDKVMQAPVLVAKGADEVALAIRELAYEHQVPIVDNPPLARSLYLVPLGQAIPEEHYQAVAEILSFLIRRRGRYSS